MSKKSNSKAVSILLLIILVFLSSVFIMSRELQLAVFGADGPEWNIKEITNYLQVSLPENVTDVQYNSDRYKGFIQLSFQAPADQALDFATHICEGVLHQGYNPFNAINLGEKTANAYWINMKDFGYYSYSLNISPTIHGNRCWDSQRGIYQILVDKADSVYYAVKFEQSGACNIAQLPCWYISSNNKLSSNSEN